MPPTPRRRSRQARETTGNRAHPAAGPGWTNGAPSAVEAFQQRPARVEPARQPSAPAGRRARGRRASSSGSTRGGRRVSATAPHISNGAPAPARPRESRPARFRLAARGTTRSPSGSRARSRCGRSLRPGRRGHEARGSKTARRVAFPAPATSRDRHGAAEGTVRRAREEKQADPARGAGGCPSAACLRRLQHFVDRFYEEAS